MTNNLLKVKISSRNQNFPIDIKEKIINTDNSPKVKDLIRIIQQVQYYI